MAVLGGGTGGIAAAYFLSGDCDVTLIESRSKVGGVCESVVVDCRGTAVTVDVGPQFFHPDTHPIYLALLEELGLFTPGDPGGDDTSDVPASLCLQSLHGGSPRFSSAAPLRTPIRAAEFAIYTQKARAAVLNKIPWELTTEDWIAGLPLTRGFKNDVLFPLIASLIGTTRANLSRASARFALEVFALAFPPARELHKGARIWSSTIGIRGNLQRMFDRCQDAKVEVGSPVREVSQSGGQWSVRTAAGVCGPFDAVVLNAPPYTSKSFFKTVPWAADVIRLLSAYEFFESRVVVHKDPCYVHPDRGMWALANVGAAGDEWETSVWLGALHPKLPGGDTVDVFKSWSQRRRADPADVLCERRYRHILVTPEVAGAIRSLNALQGRNGLYFCGNFTCGVDLQETALYSAMKVADALAPHSATLAALRRRLALRGRSGTNYDL
ncbi:amine oxidase [Streptomyces sp. NBRC 110611]|uniref:FAD-dependent oxidoreductase n=1 Tax=Streptomyces sp. NBRC 110611 TaxID=1621259 RepID=UPI00085750AD|nr:FAD-dependent oxidoreductase [Streptomyces sp. NBRC 110611]GAU69132.1 amine oxidase [Streptomyces sp. NBRC 110611]